MEQKKKNTINKPIFNNIWLNPTKYLPLLCGENNWSFFRYILSDYYDNLYGNIIQFGAGSSSGLWSYILSNLTNELTIIDYSQPMLDIVKKTLTLNKAHNNINSICQRMETYTDLLNADYILYTFCMSFSNIAETVKNLTNNTQKGCVIIIMETSKPIMKSNHVWANNLLLIQPTFESYDTSWILIDSYSTATIEPIIVYVYQRI